MQHTHTHTHTLTHTNTHAFTQTHTRTHARTNTYTHTHTITHTHTHTHTHTCVRTDGRTNRQIDSCWITYRQPHRENREKDGRTKQTDTGPTHGIRLPPASHVAAGADVDLLARFGQTDGPQVVAQHQRALQLDQRDVVVHRGRVELRVQEQLLGLADLPVRGVGGAAGVASDQSPVLSFTGPCERNGQLVS